MCQQCEAETINGVLCHEHGCPDASCECAECGCEFTPDYRGQQFCEDRCAMIYHGYEETEQTYEGAR